MLGVEAPIDPPESPLGDQRWPPLSYVVRVGATLIGLVAVAWAVVAVQHVLILILMSFVLGLGLQRPINWMERHGLRRGTALALMLTSVFVTVGVFLVLIAPSVVRSVEALVRRGPETLDHFKNQRWVAQLDDRFDLTKRLEEFATDIPSQAASAGLGVLTAIVSGLTVLVLTLYFAAALPQMVEGTSQLLAPARRDQFERAAREVTDRVGGYVVGNGLVSLVAGGVTFVALMVIGVPFPAALAFWVAITDLIPTIGAMIGAVVVLAVAASGGPGMFLVTAAFMLVYQQIENYLVIPRVMRNTINISVGAVLVSILIGGALAGLSGVLLALPITASIRAVLEELYLQERRQEIRRASVRSRLRLARQQRAARPRSLP